MAIRNMLPPPNLCGFLEVCNAFNGFRGCVQVTALYNNSVRAGILDKSVGTWKHLPAICPCVTRFHQFVTRFIWAEVDFGPENDYIRANLRREGIHVVDYIR